MGELRARLSTDIVGGLVDELERGSPVGTLQEVMRDRLRDPTLTLGFDLSGTGSYVGADGKAVEPPGPAASRTALSSGDGPRTIVYHDPAVDPELVQMIGSTAGRFGEAGHADYAAAKGAIMTGLLLSLKNEAARIGNGVRVNVVAPGWVATPMSRSALEDRARVDRAGQFLAETTDPRQGP